MNRFFPLSIVAVTVFSSSLSARADDIVDDAEEAIEMANEFKDSECGQTIKGCWKDITSAIKDTNDACREFRNCTNNCRSDKRREKKECIADRCSGLSGKAERDCKKGCRGEARLLKKSCVTACGKRPPACKSAWGAVFTGIGKCIKELKDSDCKAWAQRVGDAVNSL